MKNYIDRKKSRYRLVRNEERFFYVKGKNPFKCFRKIDCHDKDEIKIMSISNASISGLALTINQELSPNAHAFLRYGALVIDMQVVHCSELEEGFYCGLKISSNSIGYNILALLLSSQVTLEECKVECKA